MHLKMGKKIHLCDYETDKLGYKNVEFTSEVRSPKDKYIVGASAHVIATHDKFDAIITKC